MCIPMRNVLHQEFNGTVYNSYPIKLSQIIVENGSRIENRTRLSRSQISREGTD